jgi:GDP-L-fucose synthase
MKILVTGGSGLVGKAIQKVKTEHDFIFLSSKDCDLTNFDKTKDLFDKIKPDYVIHLAACVGGLFKNMNKNLEIFEINLLINFNVIKCCHLYKIKKCISCLSTCIFPDNVTYPIKENMLHNGKPHESNYGYSYAKRLLEIHSRLYRETHNSKFICIIPCNIYGENDNFSLEEGHVIPALIHQCYLSKKFNKPFVVKGTGSPLRQFIYVEDLANIILLILEKYEGNDDLIVATPEKDEISIKNIAELIAHYFEYDNIKFDTNYSDGQYKKTVDNTKLRNFIDYKMTDIKTGLSKTINWFKLNYDICRK